MRLCSATQELRGLGLANLVGAAFNCYTTTGSFSRSAIMHDVGAKTQLAGIISGPPSQEHEQLMCDRVRYTSQCHAPVAVLESNSPGGVVKKWLQWTCINSLYHTEFSVQMALLLQNSLSCAEATLVLDHSTALQGLNFCSQAFW